MVIEKVNNINDAKVCDELLTKLIRCESRINKNIKSDYVVKEYFENLYKEENCVIYVAKEQRQIVGYVYCRCTSSEASPEINPEALIDGIYVEEEYRNIGIATKLLNQVKKWAEENGIKFLYLNVLENNKNAMNLYKALGYTDFEKKLKLNLEK